ncbi:U3 small nucleolar RNA-associated protein 6 homolog isoform X4 [Rissa tridactyla]|uniref:U3 small nucleolar RNA-associated protein 6 homolog isoform X4 n=1 Tax=Rissa tridactyla TaxID=75485 RepID=UPI0023BB0033|nr:U3 small nucleolar RNA-associated protein 6 homolog isoform X4 [Rissa tridactyla]
MAERIEQRLEDRVPELEQLERVGLFTRKEIKAVLRRASALEYKIQRRALRKEDFINYIQRTGYSFKKDEIEISILHRIHSLFNRAIGKWKNAKHQLSRVFSSMLAIHPNKPALWIMAAKWEMETRLSSENARHLFLRALRFHPECPKLYQEYFRMELMNAEKQRKEKKEFERAKMDLGEFSYSEEILNGEMARIVYRDAAQKIKGVEFHLAVLSIAKLFDFTQDLQKEILESLQTTFADDPLTWDYMARHELELGSLQSTEHTTKQTKVSEMTQREERCSAVFEEAVKAVPTEDMWKYYITFCLERYNRKTNSEELKQKRLERTLSVFNKAHESSLLPEALYKQWLQLLLESTLFEKATEVAEAATKRFSLSVEMWQMRLQVLIQLKSDDVTQCFEEAIKHVKSKGTLPIWTLWVEWSEGMKSKEDTEAVYQRSLHATTHAESVTMKEKYLDWTYRNSGYKKVRRVFTSLCENRPFSLDFFRKMIQIEKEQESCKMLHLREYYERALREFGSTDSDLWLDYIKEELSHPQGKPENCGSIHWRAMKMLQGDLVEDFVSKYTLLQTGHL